MTYKRVYSRSTRSRRVNRGDVYRDAKDENKRSLSHLSGTKVTNKRRK